MEFCSNCRWLKEAVFEEGGTSVANPKHDEVGWACTYYPIWIKIINPEKHFCNKNQEW